MTRKITRFNFHYKTKYGDHWEHCTNDFENLQDCLLFHKRMKDAGFICDDIKETTFTQHKKGE